MPGRLPTAGRRSAAAALLVAALCGPARLSGARELCTTSLESLEPQVREQIQEVQRDLAATVDADSSNARLGQAYGALGQMYHAYGQLDAAECAYRQALELAPNETRWAYLLGDALRQAGHVDEAATEYRHAVELQPTLLAAQVRLGDALLDQGQLQTAEQAYRAALALDTGCAAALAGLGQVDLARQDYAGAAAHLEKALAMAPAANRLHVPLAMAYRGLGQLELARQHLAQRGTVGVSPPDPLLDAMHALVRSERLPLLRGRSAFQAGRYADAVAEFKKAVLANPRSVPARVNLGSALGLSGDEDGAIDQYHQALSLDPSLSSAHYDLAILLTHKDRLDEAAQHFRAAIQAAPADLQARLQLISVLQRAGHCANAVKELSDALSLAERQRETGVAARLRKALAAAPSPCP